MLNKIFFLSLAENCVKVSRRELADLIFKDPVKNWDTKSAHLLEYIIQKTHCPPDKQASLKKKVFMLFSKIKTRYINVFRKKDVFYAQNNVWLDEIESFPLYKGISCKPGRPASSFETVTDRTKRRKTEFLREIASGSELAFAASVNFRQEGHGNIAKAIHASISPTSSKVLPDQNRRLTPTEALCTFLDADLTVHQYVIIREADKVRFPPYKQVLEAKKTCYPCEEAIVINEKSIHVSLQALLDHSCTRIMEYLHLKSISFENVVNIKLYWKWGMDGTSGLTEYKQLFQDPITSDSSMFVTCIVPLKLVGVKDNHEHTLWLNDRSSSTRFCRPIRIQYERETSELTRREMHRIEDEIVHLNHTLFGTNTSIEHVLLFTMTDGKLCNAATSTLSTQRCYICKHTSRQFNCISVMRNAVIETDNLRFGLSILHAWIRMFECLLHVSYKLPIAKWRVNRPEDRIKVEETKKRIQTNFKTQLGLIVDQPKPGYGNSNDGNTARRFFENSEISASITGINKNLIHRFNIILITLSSGRDIDVDQFEKYCLKTAVVFVKLYPWYYMPTSVHKILFHASAVIAHFLLPIGLLSEEAQEARNKDIKRYRENFTRKFCREKCIRDVFNRLLITSDPLISSLRKRPQKKNKNLPQEVINLLKINHDISDSSDVDDI